MQCWLTLIMYFCVKGFIHQTEVVATNQGLKKGLVVAKKLVVSDFWLVVNGDWASCKSQQAAPQKSITSKLCIIMCTCIQLKSLLQGFG